MSASKILRERDALQAAVKEYFDAEASFRLPASKTGAHVEILSDRLNAARRRLVELVESEGAP